VSPKKRQPPAGKRRPAAKRQPPAKRTVGSGRNAGTRASSATPFYTPTSSRFRRGVERRSAPILALLTQAPRVLVLLVPLALLLAGFFLPLAVGLVALAIVLAYFGWLSYLSWPSAEIGGKLIRAVMFGVVIALIVVRVAKG